MLKELRTFNSESADVDEMIELSAFARGLSLEYAALSLEQPEWLETQTSAVRREIASRLADLRAKRIRELQRGIIASRTAEERRTDMQKELDALLAQGK